MDKIFADSDELNSLIRQNGWELYDVSQTMENREEFKWNDLERQGSAEEFMIGGHYDFAPIPKEGQSLRDAYSVTKGLGPALLIDDTAHQRWKSLYVTPKNNILYWGGREPSANRIALFSRLSFDNKLGNGEESVIAWTPETAHPNPDCVVIEAHLALDTFQKYFRIASMPEAPVKNYLYN